MPVGFVVLKSGREVDAAALEARLVAAVRERIGPVAAFRAVRIVEPLCPRPAPARSCAPPMRDIADGRD